MMAYPGELSRPVIGLEFGWPAIAPSALPGTVLASRYGGVQRWVNRPGRWPVPASEAAQLGSELGAWLQPGLMDLAAGVGWVCSKTEHTKTGGDQWGTAPNYAVIDHAARENVNGLWTFLPGKMTLAMHGSQEVTARVIGADQRLCLPAYDGADDGEVDELIAPSPWAAHQEAELR
ncbi:hypothetical protein AB0E01_39970 [Nocardia vinacea]|uniref:hypothetical protein n=1 Tax=Nocardia vinacea TaxID=96468 RepID=UPI0033D36761